MAGGGHKGGCDPAGTGSSHEKSEWNPAEVA